MGERRAMRERELRGSDEGGFIDEDGVFTGRFASPALFSSFTISSDGVECLGGVERKVEAEMARWAQSSAARMLSAAIDCFRLSLCVRIDSRSRINASTSIVGCAASPLCMAVASDASRATLSRSSFHVWLCASSCFLFSASSTDFGAYRPPSFAWERAFSCFAAASEWLALASSECEKADSSVKKDVDAISVLHSRA